MENSQFRPEPQGFSRTNFGGPNPQPNHSPPGSPPNNRMSVCARVKANLPYFTTIIGILKIVSVVRKIRLKVFITNCQIINRNIFFVPRYLD